MKNRWRAVFVVTIVGLLFVITDAPSDAARRVAKGSSCDGTWSVAIYTLRGDCGSLRAALRIVGGRVYFGDGSYQAHGGVGAGGAIRVTLIRGSQSASGSGRLSFSSALADGVPPGVSASARGQRREMRPITDHLRSGGNGSRWSLSVGLQRQRYAEEKPKLAIFADRIAEARRIIEAQQAQLMKLQISGQSTAEVESTLRICVSSLLHLLA
jgi:hypothetical protein